MSDMGALKGIADKAMGTAKEAAAEIIGDARLQEEGKSQKRKGATETNEPTDLKPLGNLGKLT
jgi:uncharacterized protein YjbJ (UPF0337 family)